MATVKGKKKELKGVRVRGVFGVWGTAFDSKGKVARYGFSTSISQKTDEGDYERKYIDVAFPKGDKIEFEGLAEVRVNDGFITFYETRKGETRYKIVVLDYEFVEGE